MNMKQCPKGHFYNGDINTTCPVCAKERMVGAVDDYGGATEPVSGGFGGGPGVTEPVSGGFGGGPGVTEPVSGGFGGGPGVTEPVNGDFSGGLGVAEPVNGGFSGGLGTTEAAGGYDDPWRDRTGTKEPSRQFEGGDETMRYDERKRPGVDNYNDVTGPVSYGGQMGFAPVVGWLVCIDGPDKGNDYRVRAGYNNIGRAEHMDICIRGDKLISRERHAVIAFDDTEKVFFFGPANGKNIVRINGKMIMAPSELHAYDILTVGSSKLIFVPLCGEHFDWSSSL